MLNYFSDFELGAKYYFYQFIDDVTHILDFLTNFCDVIYEYALKLLHEKLISNNYYMIGNNLVENLLNIINLNKHQLK